MTIQMAYAAGMSHAESSTLNISLIDPGLLNLNLSKYLLKKATR